MCIEKCDGMQRIGIYEVRCIDAATVKQHILYTLLHCQTECGFELFICQCVDVAVILQVCKCVPNIRDVLCDQVAADKEQRLP